MPTYEYQCKKCQERFDVFQSFSAKPLKRHQDCGGTLEKVFHVSGIVFKGSGFYVTDSRDSSSSGSTSGGTSTPSGGSSSSDGTSSNSSSGPSAPKSTEPGSGTASKSSSD